MVSHGSSIAGTTQQGSVAHASGMDRAAPISIAPYCCQLPCTVDAESRQQHATGSVRSTSGRNSARRSQLHTPLARPKITSSEHHRANRRLPIVRSGLAAGPQLKAKCRAAALPVSDLKIKHRLMQWREMLGPWKDLTRHHWKNRFGTINSRLHTLGLAVLRFRHLISFADCRACS
jgi:hypothetical protein